MCVYVYYISYHRLITPPNRITQYLVCIYFVYLSPSELSSKKNTHKLQYTNESFSSLLKFVYKTTLNMTRNSFAVFRFLVVFCLAWQVAQVNAANILGLFTSHSPSHLIVHMSLAKVLAEKGHNVTVVASQVPTVQHDKIRMIIIPPTAEEEALISKGLAGMATKKTTLFSTVGNFFGSLKPMIDMQAGMLKDARFTMLYENPDTKFDLVILGYFMNTFALGVGAKLKAPIAISWMGQPMVLSDYFVGNPSEVSYVPAMNIVVKSGEKMTFLQRLQNLFSNLFFRLIKEMLDIRMRYFYRYLSKCKFFYILFKLFMLFISIYSELFPSDKSFPSLKEMEKNISLIFCNSHFTEGSVRPNVPAVIEIGGIQVKDKPDPLPKVFKLKCM